MANIISNPEDLSAVTDWATPLRATLTTNDAVAPDGTTTAERIGPDDGNSNDVEMGIATQSKTVSATTAYTFAIFGKADTIDYGFRIITVNLGVSASAYFDIVNGVVGTTANVDDARIESFGDGWYRCYLDFTTGGDTNGEIAIRLATSDGDTNVIRDSDNDVFLWGAVYDEAANVGSTYTSEAGITVPLSGAAFIEDMAGDLVSDLVGNMVV